MTRSKDLDTEARRDEVLEAGLESFPASDPPAFAQGGPREPQPDIEADSPEVQGHATGGADSARLRGAMPSGRTMNIRASEEPSAAPLGTDDEAAGTPPGAAAVGMAMAAEAEPANRPAGRRFSPGPWLLGVAALLVVLVLWLAARQG